MANTNVAIRPLSKGMIRNLPSQSLGAGAVIEAGNFNVTSNGLKARGGFAPLILPPETLSTTINANFNYITGDVQNTFLFQENDGQTKLLTVTNEALYSIEQQDEEVRRVSFPGTIEVASITEIEAGKIELKQLIGITPPETSAYTNLPNSLTDVLRVGDYIKSGTDYGTIYEIDSTDATHYIIRINVDNTTPWVGITGEINTELNFNVDSQYKIDHALVNGIDLNKIVFASNRGLALAQYDQTGILTPVAIDSTSTVDIQYDILITEAKVTRWYRNRLWIANTVEDGKVLRQRIRWSDATTYLDLTTSDRFRPENYIDLSDSMGEVLAIYPMGELLIVYCSDAVYYGRASNYANLPYTFTKINTPGLGLVGQSAITPWIDGHYFVGQDEIYFLSAAQSLQPIGTTILTETLDICFNKSGIDVRPDPANSRITFLFPEEYVGDSEMQNLNAASKLYTYNYKTGGWSYLEASYVDSPTGKAYNYQFSSISSSMLYSGDTSWADTIALDPVGEGNTATFNWDTWKVEHSTWSDLKDGQLTDHTFLYGLVFRDAITEALTTNFHVELNNSSYDILGYGQTISPVRKTVISADYDFDLPDTNKQVNRFSLKVQDHVSINTVFNTYVSSNRGKDYKPTGELVILAETDEGKVNFRSKGSTFRFKIESDDLNINTINEFVIRLSKRGEEI